MWILQINSNLFLSQNMCHFPGRVFPRSSPWVTGVRCPALGLAGRPGQGLHTQWRLQCPGRARPSVIRVSPAEQDITGPRIKSFMLSKMILMNTVCESDTKHWCTGGNFLKNTSLSLEVNLESFLFFIGIGWITGESQTSSVSWWPGQWSQRSDRKTSAPLQI